MGKITVFDYITVDGFFSGPNGEIDWFKFIKKDEEWNTYTHKASSGNSTLLFGRTTYNMMKSFWPTQNAINMDPQMANTMNNSPKIVFSRTLKSVDEEPNWKNVRLFNEINVEEINKLKENSDMTILGSGEIVQEFTNLKLIDEYTLIVVPIILGNGKPLFKDVKQVNLTLLDAKAFKNGLVLHQYKPE